MTELCYAFRLIAVARGKMIFGFFLACLAALSGFGLLFLSGWLIAAAAAAGLGGIVTRNLFNLFLPAAGVRFFATARILTRYVERLVTHDAALKSVSVLRARVFERLIPRSTLLTDHRSGDVLGRLVSDTEIVVQFPITALMPFGVAAICGTVSVVIISVFSLQAGLILAWALLLSGMAVPVFVGRKVDDDVERLAGLGDDFRADLVEAVQCAGDITLCGATTRTAEALNATQTLFSKTQLRSLAWSHASRQAGAFITALAVAGVLMIGARALQSGALSAPELPMLILGTLAAMEFVSSVVPARQALARARVSIRRLMTLCEARPPVAEAENVWEGADFTLLVMQDVGFCYAGSQKTVLEDCSLSIHPGERVGIVGPSGAGKSSLIRLLLRLEDYQSGSIHWGGVNLKQLDTQALSTQISVLSQDFHLFQGSIRRNLLLGRPDATDEDMSAALSSACLVDEVRLMENGLDTLVGEHGMRLSGGQARRLAVAQIILRRPRWVILDEPTEGLPPEKGRDLIASLLAALPLATVLCITHRPEPLEFMQRVLRLEDGRLHEREGLP
ncbi:thiol reductant ABC exporter subunit CydC [Gluconobacter cerinus]|uniref:thiol reductant ABC exporter subunit CydC n=1 Tax=Gluconobacter cerinus TaxID=38307 RepID=UPI001B8B32DD|nr:thiol reductant ABC exporter subunit CydC [Gluconobacter cerinus]MBS0983278.1 thiol reductant ABC exporter subunit CydC [Gluconobacter cerinus]